MPKPKPTKPPKPPKARRDAPTPRRRGPRPIDAGAIEHAERITRDAEIRAQYGDGWRVGDIAYRHGITVFRVYGILAAPKLGVTHQLWGAWQHLAASGNAYAQRVIEIVEASETSGEPR